MTVVQNLPLTTIVFQQLSMGYTRPNADLGGLGTLNDIDTRGVLGAWRYCWLEMTIDAVPERRHWE